MSNDVIAGLMTFGVIVILVLAIVFAIREPRRGSGAASLTAFQDFQPKDKQQAIEAVMDQKEKKMDEQKKGGDGKATNNELQ